MGFVDRFRRHRDAVPAAYVDEYRERRARLQAYIEAQQFDAAQEEARSLVEYLAVRGVKRVDSTAMYWFLVWRNDGDRKRAQDEFVELPPHWW